MKSYIVYIIRSGATKEETEGKYIGHTDVELSEEGRKQLEDMRSELVYTPVGEVISSPVAYQHLTLRTHSGVKIAVVCSTYQ